MIVMKFGGTSLRDADTMRNAVEIIRKNIARHPLIVVSAMAGITDLLEETVQMAIKQNTGEISKLSEEISHRHRHTVEELFNDNDISDSLIDILHAEMSKFNTLAGALETIRVENDNLIHALLSIGEVLSSQILAAYLNSEKITTAWLDARKIMITGSQNNKIVPVPEEIRLKAAQLLIPAFNGVQTVVTQGFIGATHSGTPTILGRNGSDYSASLLGAAIDAEEIQIWTDVDGILSADPSIIPYAHPLEYMTFNEACELAYFGARVLHPGSIQPALEKGIPVRVLNSHFPNENGTLIIHEPRSEETEIIKSIAYKEGITLLTLKSSSILLSPEVIGDFFLHLTRHGKRVYAVSKSSIKLSLTIENREDLNHILSELNPDGEIFIEPNKVIVSVVGENMCGNPEITWQIIKVLTDHKIKLDLISQFASQISFMFIIDESDIEKTVKLLHKEFIEKTQLKTHVI